MASIGFARKIIIKLIWALNRALGDQPLSFDPPPPNAIPRELFPAFTLDNKIPVAYCYCNGTVSGGAVCNTPETYKEILKQIEKRTFKYYENEGKAFYDAFERHSFSGKTVLIWGLAGCNCEALAIWNKAAKVYVVDYNKPICDHPLIEVLTHQELKEAGLKTDFAISYSSFEHDGLGRYGDPIDPEGDLKAMRAARDFLKDDGVLLFGVPLGKDALVWNAHRIYGPIRLPLLLKGWRCVEVFDIYDGSPFDESNKVGDCRQSLMILQKINSDYPSDEAPREAIDRASNNDKERHNNLILSQINRFVLEAKANPR
jgi:hypothetical protein